MKEYVNYEQSKRRLEYTNAERKSLDCLFSMMNVKLSKTIKQHQLEWTHSTQSKGCPYDCLVTVKSYDGFIVKKFIVEVKVRKDDWPSYFLEQYKLKQLKALAKEHPEYEILYINFTPSECLIYNLSTIKLPKLEKREMSYKTFKNDGKTKIKKIYNLDKSLAKRIKFTENDRI